VASRTDLRHRCWSLAFTGPWCCARCSRSSAAPWRRLAFAQTDV